jgi:hypothetical protein
MTTKEIAKQGDTIEWSFPEDHRDKQFAGKTFRAEVGMVDYYEECYGVYAEYGQDLIPFNEAKIIKP